MYSIREACLSDEDLSQTRYTSWTPFVKYTKYLQSPNAMESDGYQERTVITDAYGARMA